MSRMAPKTPDLDAELGFGNPEAIPTKKVKLFGREWRVLCEVNAFTLTDIASGETAALNAFLRGIIHEDDRDDFVKTLNSTQGVTPERLAQLIAKLIEVASERPTVSPSPSRRTAGKKTSALKSVGG